MISPCLSVLRPLEFRMTEHAREVPLSERAMTAVDDFARPRLMAPQIQPCSDHVQDMTNLDIIGIGRVFRGGCHQA